MLIGTTGISGGAGFFGSDLCSYCFRAWETGLYLRAHQKFDKPPRKDAFDILDARYAKGEINRDEYNQMKSEIAKE